MLRSCEKLACLHSELMTICVWDGCCLLRALGEAQTPGTLGVPPPRPHASMDDSLLASQ